MSVPVLIEEKLAARSLARFVGDSGVAETHLFMSYDWLNF